MGELCRNGSWLLGSHKTKNYGELVATLIINYGKMGCRISFKVHILDVHLDRSKDIEVQFEEQGECFHQDILDLECHY